MLFSSRVRVRIRVRIRFSVWLVIGYAHVFVLLSTVIAILHKSTNHAAKVLLGGGGFPVLYSVCKL